MTAIEWVNQSMAQKPAFLCSNSNSVKLFKLTEQRKVKTESIKKLIDKGGKLRIPRTRVVEEGIEGVHVKTFETFKETSIHSLSLSSDGESFLVADNNRINLWNLQNSKEDVYSLVDYNRYKSGREDEIVKCARFDSQSQTFLYTTNTGKINICDLRESSNFAERPSLQFQLRSHKGAAIFDQYINSVSSAQFVPGQPCIVSRDYMSVKLWDLRKGRSSSMMIDSDNSMKPLYSA